MGAVTKIEWCHRTFNPWWGCVKVSPACAHCYAETFDKRIGGKHWGADAERRTFSDKHWNEPLKWNALAEKAGERHRVFCASMADVFEDRPDLEQPRFRLWKLIDATPHLDWLLLTKRPENIRELSPIKPKPNVWNGTTAENQEWADKRIPALLAAEPAIPFISYEPALGPLVLRPEWMWAGSGLKWVICGGESGAGARPMHPQWARNLRDQCVKAGVAFHFKQWGESVHDLDKPYRTHIRTAFWMTEDGKTGDCQPQPKPCVWMNRIGKKDAGRRLDGRTWDEYPEASQ